MLVAPLAHADSAFTATSGLPFATTSVWNTVIRSSPALMPNSASIVANVNSGEHTADLNDYAIPIYNATASSPTVSVTCTNTGWGTCPIPSTIHLPAGAIPNAGSDGVIEDIDWSTNPVTAYEFWQANKPAGGAISTAWGGTAVDVKTGTGIAAGGGTTGSATATNVSRLAGDIRMREISAGLIPHALEVASVFTCTGYFRYPAAKTDGPSTVANCIPEGARIQLDPSVNISSLPAGQKAIAKALQTYGAYVCDTANSPFALAFEGDPSLIGQSGQVPAVYSNAGLSWDYYDMNSIPWSSLRVLQQSNGAADTTAPATVTGVTATSTAANGATIAFNPSSDGQGSGVATYNLWRGDASYNNWVRVASGSATTLTDTTASPSTTYNYAVRAQDGVGNISLSSATVTVTTPSS
ncbi:fibronectin type III domain-containing protein [Mycobacterium sp. CBMA293]|uniref:fibronectin type III domain-containing protein n=1 Tax=unclassified Mycolicibacterium TaxID=2636767 RepID=UPI0012DC6E62|nr:MULTISPECIES: fibronectin type III domain-containing protein [unclassified Mycolicibacterium]MUL49489.1 fibronectin type III domain-containing protein [Mycolicibacterium sp. CBMA 360]MUL62073.1 fibronectin type III domain-containing protein [Mycolicibacterium sp. CBMA 335]MUL73348.1 fibronectin type III domain-containing protein [Mycolicibacterium sp. CBMA 311]MUL96517.1 fibronectin type III domain-containing protein [Mycolicibacterium sp. CBMA 230]MUM05415.1 hypothetical protein [Mycolicib